MKNPLINRVQVSSRRVKERLTRAAPSIWRNPQIPESEKFSVDFPHVVNTRSRLMIGTVATAVFRIATAHNRVFAHLLIRRKLSRVPYAGTRLIKPHVAGPCEGILGCH
jgi:hypothetical protein